MCIFVDTPGMLGSAALWESRAAPAGQADLPTQSPCGPGPQTDETHTFRGALGSGLSVGIQSSFSPMDAEPVQTSKIKDFRPDQKPKLAGFGPDPGQFIL